MGKPVRSLIVAHRLCQVDQNPCLKQASHLSTEFVRERTDGSTDDNQGDSGGGGVSKRSCVMIWGLLIAATIWVGLLIAASVSPDLGPIF